MANNCLGAVRHLTRVVPKAYTAPGPPDGRSFRDPVRLTDKVREEASLVIFMRRIQTKPERYEVLLRSRAPGEEYEMKPMGEWEVEADGGDLAEYLSDAIDPAFD